MARPRLVSQPTSDLIAAAVAALASLEQPHHASCARTWPAGNCGIRQDELGNLDQATRTETSYFRQFSSLVTRVRSYRCGRSGAIAAWRRPSSASPGPDPA